MDTKLLALAVAGAVAYHENAFNVQPKIDDAVENIKNIDTPDILNKLQVSAQNTPYIFNVDEKTIELYKSLNDKAESQEVISSNKQETISLTQDEQFLRYISSLSPKEREILMEKGQRLLEAIEASSNVNITPCEGVAELRAAAP